MKKTGFVLFILLWFVSSVMAQEPSIDQVLDRHAQALGGMEALSKFKSLQYQADVQLGNLSGTAEMWMEKPEKAKLKMDLAIMQIEQGLSLIHI